MRLQLLQNPNLTAINVSIFPAPLSRESARTGRAIATSGAYSDALSGVATPLVSLKAGKYVVVPSTYDVGVEAKFKVTVYSSMSGIGIALI